MLVSKKRSITPLKVLCSALNLLRPKQHCLKLGEPRITGQSFNSTFFKENVRTKFMNFQAFTFCLFQPIYKVSVPSLKNSISFISVSVANVFSTIFKLSLSRMFLYNYTHLLFPAKKKKKKK